MGQTAAVRGAWAAGVRRDEDFDAPALIFGILVSTVLTLVVIPVL